MKDDKLMAHDPLSDADVILRDDFYGRPAADEAHALGDAGDATTLRGRGKPRRAAAAPRPTHYKVICISMYTRDLDELDAKVAELKRRGWTKANKSQLIRLALSQLDLSTLPTPRQ
jgi:hypothetical protein